MKNSIYSAATSFMAALAFGFQCGAASIGDVDTNFGKAGTALISTQLSLNYLQAAQVQGDGRIVLAASCNPDRAISLGAFCLVRLMPNGTMDQSFGSGGVVTTSIKDLSAFPRNLLITSDGKIVVVGSCSSTQASVPCMARYSSESGALDNAFGAGGLVIQGDLPERFSPSSISIDGLGRMYIVGDCPGTTASNPCAVRIQSNGSLDAGYGVRGVIGTPFGVLPGRATSAQLDNAGRLLLSATCSVLAGSETRNQFCAARFTSSGRLDTTFGKLGTLEISAVTRGEMRQMSGSGKILLVGACVNQSGTSGICTATFGTDGGGDVGTNFGLQNIAPTLDSKSCSPLNSIELASGGYLIVGYCTGAPNTYDSVVLTVGPDGSLDRSFAESGVRLVISPYLDVKSIFSLGAGDTFLLSGSCWNGGFRSPCVSKFQGAAPKTVQAYEYRYAPLDYYFLTSRDSEKTLLSGVAGWQRTGRVVSMLAQNAPGAAPITRFFFDQVAKTRTRGSHFYTSLSAEAVAVQALNPLNLPTSGKPVNEGIDSYAYFPSAAGVCATGLLPVYRLFRGNTRFPDDPNHRFTTDMVDYNDFVGRGWDGEGVKFCVPPSP